MDSNTLVIAGVILIAGFLFLKFMKSLATELETAGSTEGVGLT